MLSDVGVGMELVIKTASRYGKIVEMKRPNDDTAEAIVKKIQVTTPSRPL